MDEPKVALKQSGAHGQARYQNARVEVGVPTHARHPKIGRDSRDHAKRRGARGQLAGAPCSPFGIGKVTCSSTPSMTRKPGRDITFDAGAAETDRQQGVERWRKLIPAGELPARPKTDKQ